MNTDMLKGFLKKNWKIILAILYLLLPLDLLPDFIPFLGVTDDLFFLLITLFINYLDHKRATSKYGSRSSKIIEGEIVE